MTERHIHKPFQRPVKKAVKASKTTPKKAIKKQTKVVKKVKLNPKSLAEKKTAIKAQIAKRTAFNDRDQKKIERIDKKLSK